MKWRTVPSDSHYECTRSGLVRRRLSAYKRKPRARYPKRSEDNDGYLLISGKPIHRLIAETWIGKRPTGFQINHKDGNKQNNNVSNLEYVSARENAHHAIREGLRAPGYILTEREVYLIRVGVVKNGRTITSASKKFGAAERTINDIVYGRTWRDVRGPIFENVSTHPNSQRLTDAQARNVRIRVIRKGATLASQATKYGVGESTIRRIVQGESYIDAGGPILKKGETAHKPQFTDSQIRRIRVGVVKKGRTIASAARHFSVGESTIGRIVYGETYVNAGGPLFQR